MWHMIDICRVETSGMDKFWVILDGKMKDF
jgi:hypothetical protein